MAKAVTVHNPEIADPKDSGDDSGTTLIPQKHGGALLTGGKPGNKGGHGVANAYKNFAAAALDQPEARQGVMDVLRDPSHPSYSTVLGKMLLYGHGVPVAPKEGGGDTIIMVKIDL